MSRSELGSFDRELRRLARGKPELRPFVCEGSPLTCEIFIVGHNPATSVGFWEFWDADYGFKKSVWFDEYKARRRLQSHREVSDTRQRIRRIVEGARPVRCLETNIYALPSLDSSSLSAQSRSTEVFDFLVRSIRPKAIFVHGKDARKRIEELSGSHIDLGHPKKVILEDCDVIVLAGSHLSRGWSYADAVQVGEKIAALVRFGLE